MEQLENQIKQIIVEALNLEDIEPGEIDSDEPLFGDGLGLDSIDALELGVELQKAFGIRINSDDEKLSDYFATVRSLAAFVSGMRASGG